MAFKHVWALRATDFEKCDRSRKNMDLQNEKRLLNEDDADPNLRTSKQAWIKEASFCKKRMPIRYRC